MRVEKVLEEAQNVEEQNMSKDFERITGIIDFDTLTEEELECIEGTSILNVRRIKPRWTEESQYIPQLPQATEICETSQKKQELTQETEEEIFGIEGLFDDESFQEEQEEVQVVKEETESSQENMEVDSPQEIDQVEEKELVVEQIQEIEKVVIYEEREVSVVREPIVETKIWAPPSSPFYNVICSNIDSLEPIIDEGLDSPSHDPTCEIRGEFGKSPFRCSYLHVKPSKLEYEQ